MSESRGPLNREEFQGVNGVVLPNEMVGEMILTFFVDLSEGVVFVIVQGGFESFYFDRNNDMYHIDNIDKVGVMLDDYMRGLDIIVDLLEDEEESPMPPYEHVREQLLTRARVKRSQRTN